MERSPARTTRRRMALLLALPLLLGATRATPATQPFDTLRLSTELARAGQVGGDPLLLLAAARLRRSVPVQTKDPTTDRAAEWIDEAERLGGSDPRVASIAADLRAARPKGRAQGPRISQALLAAGERRSFQEVFKPGIPAVVYVEGDGDSDLALRVTGSGGTACRDVGPGDVKLCAWTPRQGGSVFVEVSNVGTVRNRIILGTN